MIGLEPGDMLVVNTCHRPLAFVPNNTYDYKTIELPHAQFAGYHLSVGELMIVIQRIFLARKNDYTPVESCYVVLSIHGLCFVYDKKVGDSFDYLYSKFDPDQIGMRNNDNFQ